VFWPEVGEEDKRILRDQTDLLVGCYWLCIWTWKFLVLPESAKKCLGGKLEGGKGSGRQCRQNLRGQYKYFTLRIYVLFSNFIELLFQRTGNSINIFGFTEVHNFCRPVQLSLLAADPK